MNGYEQTMIQALKQIVALQGNEEARKIACASLTALGLRSESDDTVENWVDCDPSMLDLLKDCKEIISSKK